MATRILSLGHSPALRAGLHCNDAIASSSSATAASPRTACVLRLRSSWVAGTVRRADCARFACPFLGSASHFEGGARRRRGPPPPLPRSGSARAATMESREASLAFRAPHFELLEPLTGKTCRLEDFEDQQGLLVMFICNHCPFVVHLKESLAKFAQEYQMKGLAVVGISSNSVKTHPQDGPNYMAEDAKKYSYSFPYLYDETQEIAKAYGAACTPEFFLFKKEGRKPFELAYHGRYDETRPRSNAPITGRDLRAAADAILSGQPVKTDQRPSMGCSIKWHP